MSNSAPSFPICGYISRSSISENECDNLGPASSVVAHVLSPSTSEPEDGTAWWMWKFGGSSVADHDRMTQVVQLICEQIRQWVFIDEHNRTPDTDGLRNLPFLASSPSPTTSRKVSQSQSLGMDESSPRFTVARDHLAIVSSAMRGVTDLLCSCLRKGRSVKAEAQDSRCLKVVPSEDISAPDTRQLLASRLRSSVSDENLASQCRLDGPRACFLLEAKAELRQWGDDGGLLAAQLDTCWYSYVYGPPLMQIIRIHMNVVERVRQELDPRKTARRLDVELNTFKHSFFTDLADIVSALHTVALTGCASDPLESYVLGMGEVWAVRLLRILLERAVQCEFPAVIPLALNAREVLTLRRVSKPSGELRSQMLRKGSPDNLTDGAAKSAFQSSRRADALKYNPTPRSAFLRAGRPPSATPLAGREDNTTTEKYTIGGDSGSGSSHADRPVTTDAATYATWSFPAWESLSCTLYPPAGPISTMGNGGGAGTLPIIDWQASYVRFARWFRRESQKAQKRTHNSKSSSRTVRYVLLITGFVCRTLDGLPATLQRNGSDTSAVAFASLLRAQGVTIWSDVAGLFTGDPRYIADARPLDYLSYEEALELAGIGAKVLHPASLLPCMHMQIPMLLKSSYDPKRKGTLIADFSHLQDDAILGKIVSNLSDVALLTLSNYPLASVYRFASRFFETVEKGGGKLLLISQGASSSAISVAVNASEVDGVLCAVQEEFRHDVQDFGSHLKVTVDPSCSVLSVVGRGQTGYVGALASWCTALKQNRISIKAISQSSNELSTSFVVCKSQELAGLQALHAVVLSTRLNVID